MNTYVVVTPVRDEAAYIARTIRSMLAQTRLPLCWIIVDDGSTDGSSEILQALTHDIPWIRIVQTGSTRRDLGCAEIVAFKRGLANVDAAMPFDYIVKLDGDVELPPDYFQYLLLRMAAQPRWGIASGVYMEQNDAGVWKPVPMPAYHAAGASKVVRTACYESMGGFVAHKGWDTIDEIRAGLHGWTTGHFPELRFRHLKPEGAAMGSLRTHRFHGQIYYQTGGGPAFLLAKSLHRLIASRPPVLGGLALLAGYLEPLLRRRPRLVSDSEADFYRAMLNRRLTAPVLRLLGRS